MTYGFSAIQSTFEKENELTNLFEYCLDNDSPEVQAIAVQGLSKLMLTRMYRGSEVKPRQLTISDSSLCPTDLEASRSPLLLPLDHR